MGFPAVFFCHPYGGALLSNIVFGPTLLGCCFFFRFHGKIYRSNIHPQGNSAISHKIHLVPKGLDDFCLWGWFPGKCEFPIIWFWGIELHASWWRWGLWRAHLWGWGGNGADRASMLVYENQDGALYMWGISWVPVYVGYSQVCPRRMGSIRKKPCLPVLQPWCERVAKLEYYGLYSNEELKLAMGDLFPSIFGIQVWSPFGSRPFPES